MFLCKIYKEIYKENTMQYCLDICYKKYINRFNFLDFSILTEYNYNRNFD